MIKGQIKIMLEFLAYRRIRGLEPFLLSEIFTPMKPMDPTQKTNKIRRLVTD